jgi:divalent metal cation (Fe/Co/Zn/Cd) transporter
LNQSLLAKARFLAWFTLLYNLVEAAVCAYFGTQDRALSLLGFGGDSLIEAASGMVLIWSFRDHSKHSHAAHRLISVLLLALALFLALSAWFSFSKPAAEGPKSGLPGILISLVSLLVMFWLYRQKIAVAQALNSAALKADAFCTLSCMWLSGLLLLGSAAFAGTGKAWFDAATTLAMAVLIAREGAEEYDEAMEDVRKTW